MKTKVELPFLKKIAPSRHKKQITRHPQNDHKAKPYANAYLLPSYIFVQKNINNLGKHFFTSKISFT